MPIRMSPELKKPALLPLPELMKPDSKARPVFWKPEVSAPELKKPE